MRGRISNISRTAVLCGLTCGALLGCVTVANAATATANLTAGTLGFVSAPGNVTFSDTLNGTNQTATAAQGIDVSDATGSGTGWNVTATSTTFTSGGHTLAAGATTIAATPAVACDAGSTCALAAPLGTKVSYPYTLPAAATAPTATEMFDANTNTGMGNQTVTPTWSLAIPANTYAGTYTSTWTLSLISAP
jgi:hypothetical protein